MKKRIIMVHVHVFSWSVGVATWENVICFRQARRIIVWSGDEAGKAQSGGEGHAGSEGNRSVPGGGRACRPDGAGPAQPWQPGRGSHAQTAAGHWAFGSVSHWPRVSVRSTIRCWKEIFFICTCMWLFSTKNFWVHHLCWLELILNQFCFWSIKTVQATSQVLKTMFSSSLGNELKTLDKADIFQGLQPFFPKRKVKVYCYTRSIIMIFNTKIVCVINCIWIWRNENQMSVKSLSLIIY